MRFFNAARWEDKDMIWNIRKFDKLQHWTLAENVARAVLSIVGIILWGVVIVLYEVTR